MAADDWDPQRAHTYRLPYADCLLFNMEAYWKTPLRRSFCKLSFSGHECVDDALDPSEEGRVDVALVQGGRTLDTFHYWCWHPYSAYEDHGHNFWQHEPEERVQLRGKFLQQMDQWLKFTIEVHGDGSTDDASHLVETLRFMPVTSVLGAAVAERAATSDVGAQKRLRLE
jgi:hypothetical protein